MSSVCRALGVFLCRRRYLTHGNSVFLAAQSPGPLPASSVSFTLQNYGLGRSYVHSSTCGQLQTPGDFKEVVVFWDLSSCSVPDKLDPHVIGPNIVRLLRSNGFSGPITIHAYGNTRSLNDQDLLQALVTTGVDLHHIPSGVKDSSNHLIVDLLLWVKRNSPPAHMFLISGDKNFSSAMHKIQMRGYNILWAHPEGDATPGLLASATKVWTWDNIIKGVVSIRKSSTQQLPLDNDNYNENRNASDLSEKHSKEELQQEVEVELEPNKSEDMKKKPQGIPNKVVKKVVDIIRQRPEGFTLAAFRRQMMRSKVVLDRDFYGHKDLLSFLLSIPKLKASLVWTSNNTRTYLFTEASSPRIRDIDGNEIMAAHKHEDRKDVMTQESFQRKGQIASEQKEMKKPHETAVKNIRQEDENSRIGMSPATEPVDKSSLSSRLQSFFGKLCQTLGFGTTEKERRLLEKASRNGYMEGYNNINQSMQKDFCSQKVQSMPSENKDAKGTNCTRTGQESHDLPDESERKQTGSILERNESTKKNVFQEGSGASNDYKVSKSPQYIRKSNSPDQYKAGEKLENSEDEGIAVRSSNLGQFRAMPVTPSFLEDDLKCQGLNDLWEDLISYCMSSGHQFTKESTMDGILEIMVESNIMGLDQLTKEELNDLASLVFHEILIRSDKILMSQASCNSKREKQLRKEDGDLSTGTEYVSRAGIDIETDSDSDLDMDIETQISTDKLMDFDESDQNVRGQNPRKHLQDMLVDRLQDCKHGLQLCHVKPEFRKRYGYKLNIKTLGHTSLASLIRSLEGVVVLEDKHHTIICSPSVCESLRSDNKI